MNGKAILLIVAGSVIITAVIFYRIEVSSTNLVANFDQYYSHQTACNIAQSGVNMALRQLAAQPTWRTGFPLTPSLSGYLTVTVTDSTIWGFKIVKIVSVGIANYSQSSETRDTSITYLPRQSALPTFKALLTARTDVNVTSNTSTIFIDGRDHTITGALIPQNGTLGIYTTKSFSPGAGSQTGGTAGATDYAPAGTPDPAVVATGQPVNSVPSTPDSVMGGTFNGFPEGTLKKMAQSGIGGSQYSLGGAGLKNPLKGVTYIEGSFVGSVDGSGILVIHNSTNTAINQFTSGNFTGILIIDNLVHVHFNVTGAVIAITANPSGNVLGNGNSALLFSRQAIGNAMSQLPVLGNGCAANVLGWWE